MTDMYNNEKKIWDFVHYFFVSHDHHEYSDKDRLFIISLYYNDIQYLKNNYESISNNISIQQQIFLFASAFCNDVASIKLLVDAFHINSNTCCKYGYNCLLLACETNNSLSVIKYLIEELYMDFNCENNIGQNCLIAACRGNSNPAIIKYLIESEEMFIDIAVKDSTGRNCFDATFVENKNFVEIATYLIENTCVKLSLTFVSFEQFEQLIPNIKKNRDRLNELLTMSINAYPRKRGFEEYRPKSHEEELEDYLNVIRHLNPLMLNHNIRYHADIENPFDSKFSVFCKYVDALQYKCNVQGNNRHDCNWYDEKNSISIDQFDYRQKPELLFMHNAECFYGIKDIVYNSILYLKEIKEIANFDDTIILTGTLPSYIINLYIHSCYTSRFNINNVKLCDITQFLNFVDMYPTINVSIEKLEMNIIAYFDKNDLEYDEYIKSICKRYQLKTLYLHMHNKKLENE
jgi:hypothetical protein